MQKVIGVRFKKVGRIYYFYPGEIELIKGDRIIVETDRGLECGIVVISPKEIANDKFKTTFINRKATAEDLKQFEGNKLKEQNALKICQEKIIEHKLPMNLIEVEYIFDASKIIFSFTAENRVDFRELVRDLATIFHTRIELRQVGVRDEAKFLGGIGCCGRSLCCSSFLSDFVPVSIRMAKDQNLSLNPTKISGICGRLMCCLKYEDECYGDNPSNEVVAVKEPILYMRVIVDEGEGKIISINRQRRTATIILDNSKTVIASWDNMFATENNYSESKAVNQSNEKSEVVENKREELKNSEPNEKFPQRKSFQSKQNFSSRQKFNSQSQNKSNVSNRNKNFQKNIRREDFNRNQKHNSRRPFNNDD